MSFASMLSDMDLDRNVAVATRVTRAVDADGRLTDDLTRVVEGELELTMSDGSRQTLIVRRSSSMVPA